MTIRSYKFVLFVFSLALYTSPYTVGQTRPPQTQERAKSQLTDPVVIDSAEVPQFQDSVRLLLVKEDFPALDRMADDLRQSKARFTGGAWRLFWLYKTVVDPANARSSSNADWQAHLALLQRWVDARPKSITARISLAEGYVDYAWSARGHGYSNTVTDQDWGVFRARGEQAVKVLMEAKKLRPMCPHWYYVMHAAKVASGANRAQLRSVFEEAEDFEPYYFAYYQQYALALLPKWFGDEGESEAFAAEVYQKIGGQEGALIYFEIALFLVGDGDFVPERFSWAKLQEGFAAGEGLYGLTQYKLNRFAFMATQYGDKQAAANAFVKIGPNWDMGVWGGQARFEAQRSWAGLPPTPEAVEGRSAPAIQNTNRNPFGQVVELVDLANQAGNEGRYEDAVRSSKAAIKLAEKLPGDQALLAKAYLSLAQNQQRLGNVVEAQKTVDKAISTVSQASGTESIELAATFMQASTVEATLNDSAKQEEFLRRAIAIREKTNGELDLELPNDLAQLAFVCRGHGRNIEAIQVYQRAIHLMEASGRTVQLGPILGQLGTLYESLGRSKEAEELFLRSLTIMERWLGPNSPGLQTPLSQLVNLYSSLGEAEKAKAMQDRLNTIMAAK